MTFESRPPSPQVNLGVGYQSGQRFAARGDVAGLAEYRAIDLRQHVGVLVGSAAEHDAIDMFEMSLGLLDGLDAAVQHDLEIGARRFQAIDARIIERRNLAVLFGRQPLEPGLARMHDKRRATGGGDTIDEALKVGLLVLIIDADAALDGDGRRLARPHRGDAGRDEFGLRHQAGAEAAFLNAIGRTADVEIDFVVAEIRRDACRLGELARIGAAELQRDRVLFGREAEEPRPVAMNDGVGCHHLSIKKSMPRQLAVEDAAMPVRPIHHRGDAEFVA